MIGLFDSGLGGLTVVKEVWQQLPDYQILYLGDTARLPYGTKQAELIQRWSKENISWLFDHGAEVVIIACHTASAWAFDLVQPQFSQPIFNVITPGIKEALNRTQSGRIGVIATPGTIKSQIYQRSIGKLEQSVKLHLQSCPLLVPIIEENWIDRPGTREITTEYLKPLVEAKIDVLVLGCTHYPLIRKLIQEIVGPDVTIVDPAQATAQVLKSFLTKNQNLESKIKTGSDHQFYFSAQPYQIQTISQLCLGQSIKPKIIDRD